jgi:NTP pyrophosphatase (non-canonical NTP hydrolase)
MTKAEEERLIKLIEECGELIQIASKTLQFGYEEHYPGDPYNNRHRLENEIRDVFYWLTMMHDNKDIDLDALMDRADTKHEKAMRYTQHQPESEWKT